MGLNNVSSRYENNRQTAFSKATDRWKAPAQHDKSPSPDKYVPKASITEHVSSMFPKNKLTKFGLDNKQYDTKKEADRNNKFRPGPGTYKAFSEFENWRFCLACLYTS